MADVVDHPVSHQELGQLRQTPRRERQVISRRYERGSIVLTSNRGFSDWGAVFADQVVAAAILDRLRHHATVINIKGKSYRMRRHADALDPNKERPML